MSIGVNIISIELDKAKNEIIPNPLQPIETGLPLFLLQG